jgi:SAM-dependent methyltransferase
MARMTWSRTSDPKKRAELEELHRALKAAAHSSHAAIRDAIASGELRGKELRQRFDDVSLFERDHFVEEVLGIAYPPLEEPELAPELLAYAPSGYDEIVHAFDVTRLGPGDRFLDLGSGMGKAVLLAALLTGAESSGIEQNRLLDDLARRAARELTVDNASFLHGDARSLPMEDPFGRADVVFMYLPFTGGALATVMERLMLARSRFVCAASLDTRRWGLVAAGPPKSWLHLYRWI